MFLLHMFLFACVYHQFIESSASMINIFNPPREYLENNNYGLPCKSIHLQLKDSEQLSNCTPLCILHACYAAAQNASTSQQVMIFMLRMFNWMVNKYVNTYVSMASTQVW